jgi:hypothetical protein
MLAFGFAPAALAVLAKSGTAAPAAPISAIAASGWQATVASPAELAFLPISVSRQGFDAAGAATTVVETLLTTKRVRLPWPDQAQLAASSVALSDYVYATDTIAGVTNSSAETSPRPICNWIMPHRLVVGTTLEAELVAFHRNASGGKQVACVVFSASDGVTTVTATVSAAAVSGRVGDRNAVLSYKASLDITSLAAGLITLNARVFPRIGGAASVADSALDGNEARGFSPRYFLKNTGGKSYAYVATTGNDTTGVVSTTAATAAATPFLTVLGAINGLHTALGATSGVDMGEIRIGNDGGTPFVLASTAATRTQKVAALTITRDPAVPRANARVSFGLAAFRPRFGGSLTSPLTTGALLFRDLAIVRTGALTFTGEATAQLEILFDDCSFDNAGNTATWLSNSHDYHFGTGFAGIGGAVLGAATYEHRLWRGIDSQPVFAASGYSTEGWCVLGSAIANPLFARGTRSFSGGMVAFNTLTAPPTTAVMLGIGVDQDVAGYAIVQNLIEYVSATTNAVIRISGDAASGNNSHVILHHNTCAGAFEAGRWNVFYDEGATRRTSKLQSVVGNIAVAFYTKSDVFRGASEAGADASSATGNWAFSHGVGCRDNFSQFMSANAVGQGAAQAQDYAGLGANYGASQTARNDPLFTTYAGTTVAAGPVYTAGAGGGTYTLQAASPARAMVDDPVLNFGLSGAARVAANDAAGAYAA